MQLSVIQRILGILLALFSLTLLPPMMVSILTADGNLHTFLYALLFILISGLILWYPVRDVNKELRLRDGFVVVVLFWTVLGISGAVPLMIAESPRLSFTDAVFESVSALTTTGATVIVGIDELPKSIQFYRQELQWLGGMGIIVLAVAILPILGVGGMQLYRAETPGPIKDSKLTPRITETAKALWYIYLSLTISCACLYWLFGMTPFDAIAHSFSTVSIGGFSTHDASIGYYNNTNIELVASFFMLVSGINFTLHYLAFRHASIRAYLQDSELKAYLYMLLLIFVICASYLIKTGFYASNNDAIIDSLFQTISIATTTGFTTTSYQNWPSFLPVLLLFASFVGACAGSTGGGMKVIRIVLLFKQGMREVKRLMHPNAIIPIKIDHKPVQERVINAVWGFFATYVAIFGFLMLLLMATGLDQITAFSAMAACMNNLGPGLGDVSAHYGDISNQAKWILSFAMLLGRLEIFTLLVLFTPAFWRL